jgi:hypothetical protein
MSEQHYLLVEGGKVYQKRSQDWQMDELAMKWHREEVRVFFVNDDGKFEEARVNAPSTLVPFYPQPEEDTQ